MPEFQRLTKAELMEYGWSEIAKSFRARGRHIGAYIPEGGGPVYVVGTSINGGIRCFCDPDVMFSVYEGSGGGDSSSTGQEFGNPTLFSSHFMPAVRLFAASAPTYPANHTKRRML